MVNHQEYKESLKTLDRDIRICFLYMESIIESKDKSILNLVQPQTINLRPIETKIETIEKKVDVLNEARISFNKTLKEAEGLLCEIRKVYQDIDFVSNKIEYYRDEIKEDLKNAGLLRSVGNVDLLHAPENMGINRDTARKIIKHRNKEAASVTEIINHKK